MPRYLVNVDGKEFDIQLEYCSEKYCGTVNGKKVEVESFHLGESRSLLLINGLSLEIDIRANGYDNKRTVFMIGRDIPVEIEDYHLAQIRKTAGMTTTTIDKVLKAPMPGLIIDIKTAVGDKVKKGQALMIMEAMKMENIIKAPADGVVKQIFIEKSKSVEKDDKLIEFE